jgi:ABC-type bacteriocin/lantibiotic exporter with double-glycine peptidase domain
MTEAANNAVLEQRDILQKQLNAPSRASDRGAALDAHMLEGLRMLLRGCGWPGSERHLMEALPDFGRVTDPDEFRAVLARLNFKTAANPVKPQDLEDDVLPCLCIAKDGGLVIVRGKQAGRFETYDPFSGLGAKLEPKALSGQIYLIEPVDLEQQEQAIVRHGWLGMLTRRFRGLIATLLAITFIANLLALAAPIYVMSVYDTVIGTASVQTLGYFSAGIAMVLVADFALRMIRARAIAYLGARYDALLGPAAFQKILSLPVAMTEAVPIGAQLARLKQFENVREVFSGPLANAVLDLPFLPVFLAVIVLFGGTLVWIPVALIALYGVMAAIAIPLTRRHAAIADENRAKLQNFLIELTGKQAALKQADAREIWIGRFRRLASQAASRQFRAQQLSNLMQILAAAAMAIGTVATLGLGAVKVMDGAMTLGAMIAVMAMVWRVLSPVQVMFSNMNWLARMLQSFKQINHLMRLEAERDPAELPASFRSFKGALDIGPLSYRYAPGLEPALKDIEVKIPPGQLVAITGPSGGGKSTLLKLIAGLYPVRAGTLHLDGLDLRQIERGELRHAIAYVPQKATFFCGTVAHNIVLAQPDAIPEEVARAAAEAGLGDHDAFLPDGLDTDLTGEMLKTMPAGLKQRLMLARAYAKTASLYLLDEPADGLDDAGDEALCDKLGQLRGKATVLMITHRPSHMRICDRVLYLDRGQLVHDGTPDQVVPMIMRPL